MKNYRIVFTYGDLFAGNMVDRKGGTIWMTLEEAKASHFMNEHNAQIIKKGS